MYKVRQALKKSCPERPMYFLEFFPWFIMYKLQQVTTEVHRSNTTCNYQTLIIFSKIPIRKTTKKIQDVIY